VVIGAGRGEADDGVDVVDLAQASSVGALPRNDRARWRRGRWLDAVLDGLGVQRAKFVEFSNSAFNRVTYATKRRDVSSASRGSTRCVVRDGQLSD